MRCSASTGRSATDDEDLRRAYLPPPRHAVAPRQESHRAGRGSRSSASSTPPPASWLGSQRAAHQPLLGGSEMESLPLTAEAIAFTEKKMDMTLDDIIKMSKKKNPGGKKPPRQPIKKHPFQNVKANQGNAKVQRFMESRSSIRQGVLAQKRTNLGGNQFPATKQAAMKAATMPIRNRVVRWNKPR
ncbi:hypothetical protein GUJ93_ZPchr0010g10607 [Zizania palustris]|nr:hypothetical protein GUJ93_ZPchr0010g10607 [Zizania palustris]